MVLVLQVTVVGLVNANHRNTVTVDTTSSFLPAAPAFQSYCSQLLDGSEDVMVQIAGLSDKPHSSTWGLCLRIRGGRLGFFGRSAAAQALDTLEIPTTEDAESEELPLNDTSVTVTKVIEKETKNKKEPTAPTKTSISTSSKDYTFSLFQKGDGSETDPDRIPNRYLKMQNHKRELAKAAMRSTLKWREENDIDTILARPHPKYDVCKSVFPHYFCGRDDTNHVILLQRPGLIDLKAAEKNNLSGKELLFHYVYVMEYLWQILEPKPDETMTSIMDLQGMSLSILGKPELLNIVQMFCSVMDAHFPQRGHKMLLINAPKWFNAVYKILSPLLRETTKNKIFIYSKGKAQDEALDELLSECGGPDDTRNLAFIAPSDMERDMRDFVSFGWLFLLLVPF
jgi:hypothetical protein